MVLDTDTVVQQSVFYLYGQLSKLRAAHPGWALAAQPEPSFNTDAVSPWEMRGQRKGYFNSGIMLLELKKLRLVNFTTEVVPTTLREFTQTEFYKGHPRQGQYPPEQFIFNVALGMRPSLFVPLSDAWSASCVTPR